MQVCGRFMLPILMFCLVNWHCQDSRPDRAAVDIVLKLGDLHYQNVKENLEEHLILHPKTDSVFSYFYLVRRNSCEQNFKGEAETDQVDQSGTLYLSLDSSSISGFKLSADSGTIRMQFRLKERGDCLGSNEELKRI